MEKRSDLPFYILMILAMAAWGGSWVSAKVIAGMSSPQILMFWRYLLTALSLFPILLIRKESLRLERKTLLTIAGSALFLAGYSHFFFRGLEKGLAGAGGVLLCTINPLITYLISSLIYRHRIHGREWFGLLVGLVGGVFLLRLWEFSFAELFQSGNLFFLIAAVLWSCLALFSQGAQKRCSVFIYSFYLNGFAAAVALLGIDFSEMATIFSFPRFFWLNMIYLAFIATTFGTTAYFFSTQKLGASKGSSFIFLVPVNAVIFSFIFLKEIPQWNTLIGGTLAVLAVYLLHRRR